MTLEQLKAKAYDLIALIQSTELQLREVNQAIQNEINKPAKGNIVPPLSNDPDKPLQ